jgi:hypothetical protein
MKAYGGVDVQIHNFLTSALAGGERSASCPRLFLQKQEVYNYFTESFTIIK